MIKRAAATVAAVLVGIAIAQTGLQDLANTIFSATRTVQTACPQRFEELPDGAACGQTDARFRLFDALLEAGTDDYLEPVTAWSLEDGLYTREYSANGDTTWRLIYAEEYAPNGEHGVFLTEVRRQPDAQPSAGSDTRYNWESRLGELNDAQRGWIEVIEDALDVRRTHCPANYMSRSAMTACFAYPGDRELPWIWQQAATKGDLPAVTWDTERRSDRGSAFLGSGSSQAYLTYYTRDYFNSSFRNRLFVQF